MLPSTANNGLQLALAGADILSLRSVGTIPGVVILNAAARNGSGSGMLMASSPGLLSWKAPGSQTPGNSQNCIAGGTFLLPDGEDPSKWIVVSVTSGYLSFPAAQAVYLADTYGLVNGQQSLSAGGDLTASQASSGQSVATEYTLANVTKNLITNVTLWIDSTASGASALSVSTDGVTFYAPTSQTDAHVLTWSSIGVGGSVNLWVKRTTPASAAASPGILNVLQWAWSAIG